MINKLANDVIIWANGVAEEYFKIKPEGIWLLDSLPIIFSDLLKQFGADQPAHQDLKDAYKYLIALAGKGHHPAPFPACWLHDLKAHKVYLDSIGESLSCKKRKRKIKEEKKAHITVALHDGDEEDTDLFGDNQD